MKREDVYRLIDGEREYQDDAWRLDSNTDSKAVGSHLTLIDTYLKEAKEGYTYTDGNRKALEAIRKIAALTVRCMELHDAPARGQ